MGRQSWKDTHNVNGESTFVKDVLLVTFSFMIKTFYSTEKLLNQEVKGSK